MNTKTYSKTIAKQFGGLLSSELYFSLEKLLLLKEKELLPQMALKSETVISIEKDVDKMLITDFQVSKSVYQTCLRIITWARLTETWQTLDIVPDDCMEQFMAIAQTNKTVKIEDGKFFVDKMVKNYIDEE